MTAAQPRFLPLGDAGVVVEFGSEVRPELIGRVMALDAAVRAEVAAGRFPEVLETVPTFRSLAVLYDSRVTRGSAVRERVASLLDGIASTPVVPGRSWTLPVRYGGDAGPDLEEIGRAAAMSPAEVVAAHSASTYTVYTIGFLPGFAFMGDVSEPLRLPRRREPRIAVPAGSVAIAGSQTAVYPLQSPGGWHILGRCPVPLFDLRRDEPCLLSPGDRVRFEAVDAASFSEIQDALAADPAQVRAFSP